MTQQSRPTGEKSGAQLSFLQTAFTNAGGGGGLSSILGQVMGGGSQNLGGFEELASGFMGPIAEMMKGIGEGFSKELGFDPANPTGFLAEALGSISSGSLSASDVLSIKTDDGSLNASALKFAGHMAGASDGGAGTTRVVDPMAP